MAVAEPTVADDTWERAALAVLATFCGETAWEELGEYDIVRAVKKVRLDLVGSVYAVTQRGTRSRSRQRPLSGVAAAEESGVQIR